MIFVSVFVSSAPVAIASNSVAVLTYAVLSVSAILAPGRKSPTITPESFLLLSSLDTLSSVVSASSTIDTENVFLSSCLMISAVDSLRMSVLFSSTSRLWNVD